MNAFADPHLSFVLTVEEVNYITILNLCQSAHHAVATTATLDMISLFLHHSVCV
jgi:hypothetical protein